ncbi:MAG TPA: class I SAM-dependent methyltransferase [Fibrobacteria bacterium]|nr:class I SAM-dependent methyltransferase [Fibrobacteria bacterium]
MPVTYKEIFYAKYASTHTTHRKGVESIEQFKRRKPGFNLNFGRFLSGNKSDRIIDVGCGAGALVWWFQSNGYYNTEGIDISVEQIRIATELGVRNVRQDDLKACMAGQPGRFDMIVLRDVIEHFSKEEIIEVLETCKEGLKEGGRIVIQVPNAESPFFGRIRYGDFTHDIAFCTSSLSQLFNMFGFEDAEFFPTIPAVLGVRSLLRFFLWKATEAFYKLLLYAELGPGSRVVSQNIIAVATKRA